MGIKEIEVGNLETDKPPDHKPKSSGDGGFFPDLNPTQQLIFDDPARFILAHGEKGCRTLDTQIYTESGLIRLGKMAPKDCVSSQFSTIHAPVQSWDDCNLRSTVCAANAYWSESGDEAMRVVLSHGGEFTGSPRHPIWVCWARADEPHAFGYKSVSEIKSARALGYRFWTPLMGHPHWIGVPQKSCGFEITPKLAYSIGALIGDGSLNISTGDNRSIYFTNNDPECVEAVRAGLLEINCLLQQRRKKIDYVARGSAIREIVRVLDIDHLSYFKRIPDAIIESPKEVISEFLSGLFDTDGTTDKPGNIQFCTVSEKLSMDVQDILAAFGILCVRRPRKSVSKRPTWTLSMMGENAFKFGQEIGFKITRKQQRILKPRFSSLCPCGFNRNRYGFPDPIRRAMKEIALSSRDVGRSREWHDTHRHLHSFGSVPARAKVNHFMSLYTCAERLRPFLVSDNWLEVVSVTDARARLADLSVPGTHSFLAAGTINHNSGKTIGVGHKDIRHAYENNDALVLIVSPSIRTGNEGVWHDLITLVIPQWAEGFGLEHSDSKLDPNTKDRHIWIGNRFGGWSKLLLMSIPHSSQVKARVKGPAPSFVHIEEITECDGREYFTHLSAQIGRRRGIAGPQQFIATCNAEGPEHWVYRVFFEESLDPVTKERNPKYSIYHVPISENIHRLPDGYVENLYETYKNDPIQLRRLIHGEWISMPTGNAIFKDQWSAQVHFRGDFARGSFLHPVKGFPIDVGWDPGPTNFAISFQQTLPTAEGKLLTIVFDEINHVSKPTPYRTVVAEVLRKMDFWSEIEDFEFTYEHSADDACFNQVRGDGRFDFVTLQDLSRDEAGWPRILLKACPKGPDSVPAAVRMMQAMLQDGELYVSAKCPKHKESFEHLESELVKEGVYDPHAGYRPKRSPYLHQFDACRYALLRRRLRGVDREEKIIKPKVYACGS